MKSTGSSGEKLPRILLVGAGRFGQHHLRNLKDLHNENKIVLVGVVVATAKSRQKIKTEHNVKTYAALTPELLKEVDAVDIVTPPETHFEIVSKCLRYADVFVEKPLASSTTEAKKLHDQAKKYKRTLTVGHIFRHDPVSVKLKKLLGNKKLPKKIHGSFLNPVDTDSKREPSFELLHLLML